MSFPAAKFKVEIVLHTFLPLPGTGPIRLRFHAGVNGLPVSLPRRAAIFRKCLFKAARIRSDLRPDISHQNTSAVEQLGIEKFATPLLELAYRGRAQRSSDTRSATRAGIGKAPLVSLRIVQT